MEQNKENEASVAFLESVIKDYEYRVIELKTIHETRLILLADENKMLKKQVKAAKLLAETVVVAMETLKEMGI